MWQRLTCCGLLTRAPVICPLSAQVAARAWLPMARLVQAATDAAMVTEACRLARTDRTAHPDGGVLLVAESLAHVDTLLSLCAARGVRAGGFGELEAADAANYAVVVVPKDKDRGYNSAVRLGHMVTGAYAGNGASRHQMRGRLRRLGQKRPTVSFTTCVMENSILHLLHRCLRLLSTRASVLLLCGW